MAWHAGVRYQMQLRWYTHTLPMHKIHPNPTEKRRLLFEAALRMVSRLGVERDGPDGTLGRYDPTGALVESTDTDTPAHFIVSFVTWNKAVREYPEGRHSFPVRAGSVALVAGACA